MIKLGFQPDRVTFNTIINGLVVNNDLKQATLLLDLLRKMELLELSRMRSYTPPSFIAALRFQPLEDARSLLFDMLESDVSPNVQTFRTLVDMLCKEGMVKEPKAVVL
ncbi:hypothetical protein Droror1_Dr00019126 [Drosera rotundifolia]